MWYLNLLFSLQEKACPQIGPPQISGDEWFPVVVYAGSYAKLEDETTTN